MGSKNTTAQETKDGKGIMKITGKILSLTWAAMRRWPNAALCFFIASSAAIASVTLARMGL